MNNTTSTFAAAKSESLWFFPSTPGSSNAGAFAPISSVFTGSAPKAPNPKTIPTTRASIRFMIRSFSLLAAFALFTRQGAQFGTVTLAANAVLMNFFLVGGYFLDGFATAAEQLAGRAVGARYAPAFRAALKLTAIWVNPSAMHCSKTEPWPGETNWGRTDR